MCANSVGDIMTNEVITGTPNMSMRDAATIMAKNRLHHLPIVDEGGELVGMLTSSDVLKDILHTVRRIPPAAP